MTQLNSARLDDGAASEGKDQRMAEKEAHVKRYNQTCAPHAQESVVTCCEVSDEILVAMMNRDVEMKELVLLNNDLFERIRCAINNPAKYKTFFTTLLQSRSVISDRDWIIKLESYISHNPSLVAMFRDLVGYDPSLTDEGYGIQHHTDDGGENEYFAGIDLALIRDYPEKLATFEEAYPQFFINAKTLFSEGGLGDGSGPSFFREGSLPPCCAEHDPDDPSETEVVEAKIPEGKAHRYKPTMPDETELNEVAGGLATMKLRKNSISYDTSPINEANAPLSSSRKESQNDNLAALRIRRSYDMMHDCVDYYEEFKRVLFADRNMLSDEEWDDAIYELLGGWPTLLAQLKEIVAYEVEYEP